MWLRLFPVLMSSISSPRSACFNDQSSGFMPFEVDRELSIPAWISSINSFLNGYLALKNLGVIRYSDVESIIISPFFRKCERDDTGFR